ncbi:MAG: hypothetical protein LBI99_00895 [Propionibacteriaceae bacterium]|jgi:hypothetical protein|nr:hypothetical protein [Propionibacteriaceae bacterium]
MNEIDQLLAEAREKLEAAANEQTTPRVCKSADGQVVIEVGSSGEVSVKIRQASISVTHGLAKLETSIAEAVAELLKPNEIQRETLNDLLYDLGSDPAAHLKKMTEQSRRTMEEASRYIDSVRARLERVRR